MSDPQKPRDPRARPQGALVYQLKRPLAELPDNLRLRNHEWGALFAVTGEHSCAQIAGLLGLSPEERDRVFGRLAAFGLIEERPLTYGEYLRALATWRDDEPRTLAAFLRGGQAMPEARAVAAARSPEAPVAPPAPPRAPAVPKVPGVVAPGMVPVALTPARPSAPEITTADSDPGITRALPTFDRRQFPARQEAPPPAFLPLDPLPPAAPASAAAPVYGSRSQLSLKALMQHILTKAGDQQAGQLDIYRVFIRINTKLLQRNGITTLRFQEDRLIDDPELQSAIASSVEKALGFACPPEVFVQPA